MCIMNPPGDFVNVDSVLVGLDGSQIIHFFFNRLM